MPRPPTSRSARKTSRLSRRRSPSAARPANATLDDRVKGFDTGADDYLVKPFAFAEVVARMRALLRRGRSSGATRLSLADLDMDLVARKVTRAGRKVELTLREFELLEYLLRYEGQV